MKIHDALQAFHFIRPAWLLVLPLAWGVTAWLARRRANDGNWSRLIDPDLLPGLRIKAEDGVGTMKVWPWLLCVWSLAVLALAGPSWEHDAAAAYRAPGAWMLVLDLSPSMTMTDLSPNRVTRARYALDDVLDGAHDAKVGLIVFSDDAYTVAPLTDDAATIRALLPPLVPDIMPSAGNNLAPALKRAGILLERSGVRDKQLVLMSDGFDDPAAALQAASLLKSQGITVNVVGVGTSEGAPIQDASGKFELDARGKPLLARLDTDSLRQVATAGGGRYVDLPALPSLITELRAQSSRMTGATTQQGVQLAHWLDGGVWLLPVLLLLAALLARRGWL